MADNTTDTTPVDNTAAGTATTVDENTHATRPHGHEQAIKMEMLDMIHGGRDPFEIIMHIARWLEQVSDEPGYARYVEDQLQAIYGLALQHVRPMQAELAEVEARLQRIRAAYENPDFTEEEHTRIGFAIEHHEKDIARLQRLIHEAEVNHTDTNIKV